MLLIERRKFTLIHRNHSEFDSTAHFDCDPKLHALHCLKCLCSLYLPLLSPTVFNNMLYCELFAVHGYRLGCVVFWFTSGRFTISSGIMHSARWNGKMKPLHFLNDTISTAAASKEKKKILMSDRITDECRVQMMIKMAKKEREDDRGWMEGTLKWWEVSYEPVLWEIDGWCACVGGVVLGELIVCEVVLSRTDGASGQMSE